MSQPPYVAEQMQAAKVLMVASKGLSESMEKFVQWCVGGFAVAFTYLLGQNLFRFSGIDEIGTVFVVVAVMALFQRYISMGVIAVAGIFQEAEKVGKSDSSVNALRFLQIYINSVPYPIRWGAALATADVLDGNMIRVPRFVFWATFVQCIVGATISVFLVRAAYVVLTTATKV
jgi:hypothetical protein